jgi:hypothetical protein
MDKKPQYHCRIHKYASDCPSYLAGFRACSGCADWVVEPSSPKDKCNHIWTANPSNAEDICCEICGVTFFEAPQPEPMPLVELPPLIAVQIEAIICNNCPVHKDCKLDECESRDTMEDVFWKWHISQWQAHDQQVRKAVIEEVCKLLDDELRIISPNTEAKLIAHLRAMAEGGR